jgi:uncharacterized protein (DUF2236 family)
MSAMSVSRGLLGPRSVTWHLHADPAMWVAGISALYLQALHPRAAAGVVQNSAFRRDPLGRLARTATFVSLTTYGEPSEIRAGAERVRGIHRRLRGRDRRSGEVFPLDDPELLLWVHCAETVSYLAVVTQAGYSITPAQADRYLAEQQAVASLVGLAPAGVPGSRRAMRAYFQAVRPSLSSGPDAEVVYQFLHHPPLRRPLSALVGLYRATIGHLAYSLLPAWARDLYGYPAYPQWRSTTQLRALRAAAFTVPSRLRWNIPTTAGHVLDAITELGPIARPSADKMPTS